MNAQNNSLEKLYLVSFGHSDKYILRDTEVGEKSKLTRIEAELNEYLRKQFADETFAYFTSPRVDDISEEGAEKYAGYPKLDAEAVEAIKKVLAKEVKNMEFQDSLDSNAPYSNVNPAAADIPHIL
ncbi:MAG: hypothetical protein K2M31_00300 [Muribaculaceae bacterium]|nr:hypothetical protein [Muribaculaceae bacterium]